MVYALLYINGNKTRNIEMSNVSLNLKYHQFEVVNSKSLIMKVKSKRKKTTLVDYVIYPLFT